MSEIWLHQRQF